MALLHALRANDRLAISKLVTSLVRGSVRSPLAQCLLVRYVSQVRRLPWSIFPACMIRALAQALVLLSVHVDTLRSMRKLPSPSACVTVLSALVTACKRTCMSSRGHGYTSGILLCQLCERPCIGGLQGEAALLRWPQVIAESGSPSGSETRPYYDFLETCLRHKAEMVIFEAARAICEMRDVSSRCAGLSGLRVQIRVNVRIRIWVDVLPV